MTNGTNHTPFAEIGRRLRWHREVVKEGMLQRHYAEHAGLQRTQYTNCESGAYRISLDSALKLRRAYGLSLDFIYEGDAATLPLGLYHAWLEYTARNERKGDDLQMAEPTRKNLSRRKPAR